nr:Gag-pre-integrase domain, Gag-polypeptide of LTR copia-type [Tanacetum cinerariifolium]
MAQKESEQGEWIFDSGCTEYITHLSNALTNNKDTPFENLCCVMLGLRKRNLIGMGRCKGGLYKMKMTRERRAMATTIETW